MEPTNEISRQPLNIEYREGYLPEWTDAIMEIHNKTPMKRAPEFRRMVREAFMGSFAVVTAWAGNRLVGCGRMISDGNMYTGIFDVVVDPDFQKRGIGKQIMTRLMNKGEGTCIYLSSTFGNEEFYRKLGFKKHKTAMAHYPPQMGQSPYLEHEVEAAAEIVEQPTIETLRLVLEPYKETDLQDIFTYASSPQVTRFLLWKEHQSLEDSRAFYDWVQASTRKQRGDIFFVFAIREKATGRVIGSIDFKNVQPWTGQIDYALGVDSWGKGFMTEAAIAVRDWALQAFPEIVRIQSFCQPENVSSARVMLKLGMHFEGVRKKSLKVKGNITDLAYYAFIR